MSLNRYKRCQEISQRTEERIRRKFCGIMTRVLGIWILNGIRIDDDERENKERENMEDKRGSI